MSNCTNDLKREASITLPHKDNNGHSLAHVHDYLQQRLIARFGGFTAVSVLGGWQDEETGKVYKEEGSRYLVACSDNAVTRMKLEAAAWAAGTQAEQLCVYVTHADQSVRFVSCAKHPTLAASYA